MAKRTVTVEVRQRYQCNLRLLRLRKGIPSVAMMARIAGLPRSTLSDYERHKRLPCIQHGLLLMEALGCRLDDLYSCIRRPEPQLADTRALNDPALRARLRAEEESAKRCRTCGKDFESPIWEWK